MERIDRIKMALTFEALYGLIPDNDCTGRCWPSCSIIPAAPREVEKMVEASGGKPFGHRDVITCDYLTEDQRCSVYEARPFICRLYGASGELPCDYGCALPAGALTKAEAEAARTRYYELAQNVFAFND
jgi:Fe-S-cluster containining protein